MTLDQLIFNYELAKANVAGSGSSDDRKTYFDLVGYYEKRINAARRRAAPVGIGMSRDRLSSERFQ
ncbi:hypothetical protein [Altererythrobacter xiamenensis]|uniref:hypothetical protein n=1 Tax=Altererythrobacter xiamenensis TaxID=1316679 RepID=UPI001177DB34|nr:hypothetical protein [Altererythrobacter xiamenensis]